jgi:hypothetical protein
VNFDCGRVSRRARYSSRLAVTGWAKEVTSSRAKPAEAKSARTSPSPGKRPSSDLDDRG